MLRAWASAGTDFGHAMGGKDHGTIFVACRDLAKLLDEDRTLVAQSVHDEAVVNDLVTHIDRGAEALESQFHDLDGPVDTCAKAARGAKKHVKRVAPGPASGVSPAWIEVMGYPSTVAAR